MISVLVADDNAVVRQGLRAILSGYPDIQVVAEATTGAQAARAVRGQRVDVAILDVRMPVMDGVEAAAVISPTTRVLMLTYQDAPDTVAAAIRAGASGYLVHGRFTPVELVDAVREVAAGGNPLSPAVVSAVLRVARDGAAPRAVDDRPRLTQRQVELMGLIASGRSDADIAGRLGLSTKTVKNHINAIYAVLQVRNRTEAMSRWLGLGGPDQN